LGGGAQAVHTPSYLQKVWNLLRKFFKSLKLTSSFNVKCSVCTPLSPEPGSTSGNSEDNIPTVQYWGQYHSHAILMPISQPGNTEDNIPTRQNWCQYHNQAKLRSLS
jgi:hypothetical protein